MALNLAGLISDIEAAYQDAEDNPGAGNTPLATAVATAIDAYVKTAVVSTVVTTPNTINGTGTGGLS